MTMKKAGDGKGKINFEDPAAQDIIERFLKHTDFEFECSKIVGRGFNSIDDHADYLRGGGCSEIIDVLTS